MKNNKNKCKNTNEKNNIHLNDCSTAIYSYGENSISMNYNTPTCGMLCSKKEMNPQKVKKLLRNQIHDLPVKATKPFKVEFQEENRRIIISFREKIVSQLTGEVIEKRSSCSIVDNEKTTTLFDKELGFYLCFLKYVFHINHLSSKALDDAYTFILAKNRKNILYYLKAFFINNVRMTTENALRYLDKLFYDEIMVDLFPNE